MQTPQQRRAAHALQAIRALETKEESVQAKYKSYARMLPFMIRNNGLGLTAAFYCSKGTEHRHFYDVLSQWLCREDQPFAGQRELIAGVTGCEMSTYLAAQVEAIALASWLSQFAQAFLADEPVQDEATEAKGGGS